MGKLFWLETFRLYVVWSSLYCSLCSLFPDSIVSLRDCTMWRHVGSAFLGPPTLAMQRARLPKQHLHSVFSMLQLRHEDLGDAVFFCGIRTFHTFGRTPPTQTGMLGG